MGMRKLTVSQDRGILVGLDIGTTKICCIIAQQSTNDGLKLLGAGIGSSAGIDKGMVVNIEEAVDSIESAVSKAESMGGQRVKNAYIGISGDHIRGINTQGAIAISKNGHSAVYDHEITSWPFCVSKQLFNGLVHHWTSPNHCVIFIYQVSNRECVYSK